MSRSISSSSSAGSFGLARRDGFDFDLRAMARVSPILDQCGECRAFLRRGGEVGATAERVLQVRARIGGLAEVRIRLGLVEPGRAGELGVAIECERAIERDDRLGMVAELVESDAELEPRVVVGASDREARLGGLLHLLPRFL